MLALALGLGCSALFSLEKLAGTLDDVTHKVAKRADLAGVMEASAGLMRTGQRGVLLYTLANDSEKARQSDEMFRSEASKLQTTLNEFQPLVATESGRQSIAALQSTLNDWQQIYKELAQRCASQQLDKTIFEIADRGAVQGQKMSESTAKLLEIQRAFMKTASEEATAVSSQALWTTVIILLLSLVAGTGGLYVVRSSNKTLQHAAGELGQSAEQVANAAHQISSSSQSLAQGASEQAATLEETSASSEEISAMTRKNADDSSEAAKLMNEAGLVVNEANHTLEQMESSMQGINASSEKIGKIIKVIDEIAFQTNILALNAAVEAARAGEAGMGFAVVADEVRNLAQRSAQAAKDTADMIEDSISKSAEGRIKLEQVSKAIRAITERTTKVKVLVDNVNLGSAEQARGTEQISKAISQVEQVTQTSAAGAEETASAGEELNSQADALKDIVSRLEDLVGLSKER